ncbi:Bacteriophage Gp15 protein [compost metagenome]
MAVDKALFFLDCGDDKDLSKKAQSSDSYRIYSFTKDAKYIYSAIKQTHDIDLESVEYMHWWKFVYLFLDLNKDCFFSQMLQLRDKKRRGKLTKDEKVLYEKLRNVLEIEQNSEFTEEEQSQIDKFNALLIKGRGGE